MTHENLQTVGTRRAGRRGKLDERQVILIVSAYQAGYETVQEIANRFNVSRQYIYRALLKRGIAAPSMVRRVPAVTATPAKENTPDAMKSESHINSTTAGAMLGESALGEV